MRVECFKLTLGDSEPIEELLVTYDLDEIEKYATNDVALKANSTVPKVSLSFELSRSQFFKLKQVQVKIDETVVEEVVPEPKKGKISEVKEETLETTEQTTEKSSEEATE